MRYLVLPLMLGAVLVAQAAPSTRDVPFKTLEGQAVTLERFGGQVVVVHVFTTWDMPGLRQVSDLKRLLEQHPGKVAVVGVGLDMEGRMALQAFEKTLKPGYPVWLPGPGFVDGHTPFGKPVEVPRLYLISRDSTVRSGFVGYVPYEQLHAMVTAELKRK